MRRRIGVDLLISVQLHMYIFEKGSSEHILILSAGECDQRIMANPICPECKLMPTHHTFRVCGEVVCPQCSSERGFMSSTMWGARTATKILCKIISSLSVYNPQWIIHAGYVEDLCVIPAARSEDCLKLSAVQGLPGSKYKFAICYTYFYVEQGCKITEYWFVLFKSFFS